MTLPGAGPELRRRREKLGLSVEEAARRLRLDPAHVRALEDGRADILPAGPYTQGWLRSYRELLELPVEPLGRAEVLKRDADRVPLWALRAVAGGLCALAALLAVLQVLPDPPTAEPVSDDVADQRLAVVATADVPVRVWSDGTTVWEGRLASGQRIDAVARERLEVEVGALDAVRVSWNDELIAPEGRQETPRRLVFVDDAAGGP